MEGVLAAVFFVVVVVQGHPVHQLQSEPMPLAECLDETRRFLLRNHQYRDGAVAQAGCMVAIAPSIEH